MKKHIDGIHRISKGYTSIVIPLGQRIPERLYPRVKLAYSPYDSSYTIVELNAVKELYIGDRVLQP